MKFAIVASVVAAADVAVGKGNTTTTVAVNSTTTVPVAASTVPVTTTKVTTVKPTTVPCTTTTTQAGYKPVTTTSKPIYNAAFETSFSIAAVACAFIAALMISQIVFAAAVSAQYAQTTTTTTTTVATTPCTTAAPTTTPCTTDAPKATTTPCDVPVVTTQAAQPAYTSPAANVYNAPATTTTKAAYGGPVVAGSAANVASVAAFVAAAFLAL